jgi:hypothetical protein
MIRWFHRNRKRGQITPFLIALIVILLSAIMLTVNVGKVSMTKTNTANSADAGALAGATHMVNGLNAVKDISNAMFAAYLTAQITLYFCLPHCKIAKTVYATHVAAQGVLLAKAIMTASDALEDAEEGSLRLAFTNAVIDEAKPRNSGESYEAWQLRKSRFEEWMDRKDYRTGNYTWEDPRKYGQTASAGGNYFHVTSTPPDWTVMPLPGVIWFTGGLVPVPIGPPCPCCLCCYCGPLPTLWGIAAVIGDTSPIKVEVTRAEPDINLGLWRMRYPAEGAAGGTITSSSWAQAYGGCVLPFCPNYDSRLTEVE